MISTGPTTAHTTREVRQIDEGLFVLVLERNGLAFVPGDCVALHADAETSRPYSIASGDREETLQFIIRELPGGAVSPWLRSRTPGNSVQISPPFGWFRPGQGIEDAPFVFLATGTGIAPFLSYFKSGERMPPEQILWGVREKSHAIGFNSLSQGCPVQLAVSRERAAGHFYGRITGLLPALAVDPDTHYYLCGLESMIDQVSESLQARGVDLFHLHREVFFHDE